MVPLPVGLAARSFDSSSAMSNFLGVASLSLQLGAFSTVTDFYVMKSHSFCSIIIETSSQSVQKTRLYSNFACGLRSWLQLSLRHAF
jgi:hypothetical protein